MYNLFFCIKLAEKFPESTDGTSNAPYPYNPNYHETKQETPKDKDEK